MINEEIYDFAEEQGYETVREGKPWNGYNVYIPGFKGKGVAYVGYPLVILEKNGEIRMSTVEESFEYLDFSDPVDEE